QWIRAQPSVDLDYMECVINQEYILTDAASEILDIPSSIIQGLVQMERLVRAGIEETQHPVLFALAQGERGRPKYEFSVDLLTHLLEMPLPIKYVASLLRVSEATIFKRMCENGISTRTLFSSMTDEELDDKIKTIKVRGPNAGYRLTKGLLQSEGHHVQRERIKDSMHRVDSVGILSRLTRMGCTGRRTYSVKGPLSLVHIDTDHKLIRYNVVIFGGVDGYSRKIMYLNAATVNKSSTALNLFLESVQQCGWPQRYVRGDEGVENVSTARCMFTGRSTGRGSFVSGKKSNDCGDIWMAVTQVYYEVLHTLEQDKLLDICNNIRMFCVHYVFLPRLIDDLQTFTHGWDNHSIRTEQNLTPNQLWVMGHMKTTIDEPENLQQVHNEIY
uniref:Integrase core domain-containing protein n=1 Tax=Nothobranchius furzeri TaxID=105023 RepID=A0A8C6Q4W0_NOTFU